MDNNVYEIVFKNDTQGKRGAIATDGAKKTSKKKTDDEDTSMLVKGIYAIQKVKTAVTPIVQGAVARAAVRSGRNEYAERVQEATSFGLSAAGFLLSEGVLLASGNIPLALLNAAATGVSAGVSYINAQAMINEQKNIQDVTLALNRERAGYSGSRMR